MNVVSLPSGTAVVTLHLPLRSIGLTTRYGQARTKITPEKPDFAKSACWGVLERYNAPRVIVSGHDHSHQAIRRDLVFGLAGKKD